MNSNKVDEMFNPTSGLDEMLQLPTVMKILDGSEIQIPRPSWRAELTVIKSIGTVLEAIRTHMEISWQEIMEIQKSKDKDRIYQLALKAAEYVPDEITKIVAGIINQTEEFVEQQLDLPMILEILLPFLLQRAQRLTESMSRMDVDFARAMRNLQGASTQRKARP